ncbi:MAG: heme o synthase [Polyangiaceae bacterium]
MSGEPLSLALSPEAVLSSENEGGDPAFRDSGDIEPISAAESAQSATQVVAKRTTVSDLVMLAKPRITVVVLATALAGYFFAGPATGEALPGLIVGTTLIVGGANALNMWIERDSDRFMSRTKSRPLPAGRMAPWVALVFGLVLTAVSIPVLLLSTNAMTTLLAVIANVSYVAMYTPLKRRSWTAVLVGGVPGAMPPLMGWAAATGGISAVGVSLFLLMFAWQVPHFHAIALFRREEYERAGLVVLPNVWGVAPTLLQITSWTVLLVSTSLLPFFLGATSVFYLIVALVLGLAFIALSFAGFTSKSVERWARSFFGFSIPYMIAVFAAMIATRLPNH